MQNYCESKQSIDRNQHSNRKSATHLSEINADTLERLVLCVIYRFY